MSATDAVKAARSPQEAMLALAEALDRIEQALAQKPSDDGWGGWSEPMTSVGFHVPTHDATNLVHRERPGRFDFGWPSDNSDLDGLDPGERAESIAARQRLQAEGRGRYREDPLTTEFKPEAETPDVGLREVAAAPVSEEKAYRRAKFAEVFLELDQNFRQDGLTDAYAKGGPAWLYSTSSGRKFILGLPYHVRQAMVNDIEEDSPSAAAEFARDVLMARSDEQISNGLAIAEDVVLGG